jgi:hypothetical protein
MSLSSNAFRPRATRTSPTRGWPVDVPSIDGRMLAVGSELAVATSWRARKANRGNAIQEKLKLINYINRVRHTILHPNKSDGLRANKNMQY